MNRRGFLKLLGMGAAAAVAAPAVSYFLPPVGGWHSDVIAHPEPNAVELAMRRMDRAYEEMLRHAEELYSGCPRFGGMLYNVRVAHVSTSYAGVARA